MKPLSLYMDTSTIGGYYDVEFEEATQELWASAKDGKHILLASELTEQEIMRPGTPQRVKDLFSVTFKVVLPITEEAILLAKAYMEHRVVPKKYYDDGLHVAIATVHRLEYVVSWNYTHLVNVQRRKAFNGVNLLEGYGPMEIVTPKEFDYEE